MRYPSEFSSEALAAVEAAMIRARRKHFKARQEWNSDWPFDDDKSVRTWILSIFLVYARQAIHLGAQDVWDLEEVRTQALEGLRLIMIAVVHTVGLGYWIDNWGGHIKSDVMRKFEAAPEWEQFEDELLALAESKAGGARAGDGPDALDEPTPVDLDASRSAKILSPRVTPPAMPLKRQRGTLKRRLTSLNRNCCGLPAARRRNSSKPF